MRIHTLKLNYNHLKREIEFDYINMRQVFYTGFVLCMAYLDGGTYRYLNNAIVEDAGFRHLPSEIMGILSAGISPFDRLGLGNYPNLIQDMIVYLDEFMVKHHHPHLLNIYDLTLDEKFNIVISIKQVRHANQNTYLRDNALIPDKYR